MQSQISIARADVSCALVVFTVEMCCLAESIDAQLDFYSVHIHADRVVLLTRGLSFLYFLLSLPSGTLAASISS